MKSNITHETFVYGYDSELEEFYVKDYFGNWRYATQKISFSHFAMAYESAGIGDIANEGAFQQITLSKITTLEFNEGYKHTLNFKKLAENISNYLMSTTYTGIHCSIFDLDPQAHCQSSYGIHLYDILIKYILLSAKSKTHIDERLMHFMYSHKRCIAYKFFYLRELIDMQDLLIDKAKRLEEEIFLVRNIVLKYNITREETLCKKIIEKLCVAYNEEYKLLGELYNVLQDYRC